MSYVIRKSKMSLVIRTKSRKPCSNYQQSKIRHLWKPFRKSFKVEILSMAVETYGLNCFCSLRFQKQRLGDLPNQMIIIIKLFKFYTLFKAIKEIKKKNLLPKFSYIKLSKIYISFIPPPIWCVQPQM